MSTVHGEDAITSSFTSTYWKSKEDWIWDTTSQSWDTPEIRHLANNVLHDPMTSIIAARRETLKLKGQSKNTLSDNNSEHSNQTESNDELDVNQLNDEGSNQSDSEPEDEYTSSQRAIKAAQELQAKLPF